MKKGIYLQGIPQTVGSDKDAMEMVRHIIVELTEPVERKKGGLFLEKEPIIREVYLKPEVLDIMPSGTHITFELDTKLKKTEDGRKYEKIVPVEIKQVAGPKQTKDNK